MAENTENNTPVELETNDRVLRALGVPQAGLPYADMVKRFNGMAGFQLVDRGAITKATAVYAGDIQLFTEALHTWHQADPAAAEQFANDLSIPVEDGRINYAAYLTKAVEEFRKANSNANTETVSNGLSQALTRGTAIATQQTNGFPFINQIPQEHVAAAKTKLDGGPFAADSIKIAKLYEAIDPNIGEAGKLITAMHYVHRSNLDGVLRNDPDKDFAEKGARQFEKLFGDETPAQQELFGYVQKASQIARGELDAKFSKAEELRTQGALNKAIDDFTTHYDANIKDNEAVTDEVRAGYDALIEDARALSESITKQRLAAYYAKFNQIIDPETNILAVALNQEDVLPDFLKNRVEFLSNIVPNITPDAEENSFTLSGADEKPLYKIYDVANLTEDSKAASNGSKAYEYIGEEKFNAVHAMALAIEASLNKNSYGEPGIKLHGTKEEKRLMYFAIQRLNKGLPKDVQLQVDGYKPMGLAVGRQRKAFNAAIDQHVDQRGALQVTNPNVDGEKYKSDIEALRKLLKGAGYEPELQADPVDPKPADPADPKAANPDPANPTAVDPADPKAADPAEPTNPNSGPLKVDPIEHGVVETADIYPAIKNEFLKNPEKYVGYNDVDISDMIEVLGTKEDFTHEQKMGIAQTVLNQLKRDGVVTTKSYDLGDRVASVAQLSRIPDEHLRRVNFVISDKDDFINLKKADFITKLKDTMVLRGHITSDAANTVNPASGKIPAEEAYDAMRNTGLIEVRGGVVKGISNVADTAEYAAKVTSKIDHAHTPEGEEFHKVADVYEKRFARNRNLETLENHAALKSSATPKPTA